MANKSFHTSALNLAGASTKLQTLWLGSPSPAFTRLWGLYKRVENQGGWGTWIDGNSSSSPFAQHYCGGKKINFWHGRPIMWMHHMSTLTLSYFCSHDSAKLTVTSSVFFQSPVKAPLFLLHMSVDCSPLKVALIVVKEQGRRHPDVTVLILC